LCATMFEGRWDRSAMRPCGELLEAVIAADRVNAEHEKRLRAVTEEVKQLQVKHAELEASVKDIRARLDRFRADLARQAVVRARLPLIDAQRSDVGRSP
jgi:uncharacterized protein YlxW (UPF0749 family)